MDAHPENIRKPHAYSIGMFLMALGRLKDGARQHMQSLADGVDPQWERSWMAYMQDDLPTLRRLLPSIEFKKFPPRTAMLVRAGLVDKAREVLRTVPAEGLDQQAFQALGRGDVLLIDNQPAQAIPLLKKGVAALKASTRLDYYIGCESLATALKRVNRVSEGLEALEECRHERPRYSSILFITPAFWMHLQLRLADDYREAGRVAEAQKIEEVLRKLLAYADADHPILVRLNAR